jgi:SAM-dependent methyltransferase
MRGSVEPESGRPRGLNGALSRLVKEFRLRQAVPELLGAASILDLGCGLCEIVPRLDPAVEYLGVERDVWMFDRARARFPGRRFLRADIEETSFDPGGTFERVLLLAVWEHLRDPAEFFGRAGRWLAPGGRMILTTPSPLAHRVIEGGAAIGLLSSMATEEHERLWTAEEIEALGARTGWTPVRARRFLLGLNQLVVLARVD